MAIFDFSFHHPNPWIDDLLHGDHTHTDDDGNEVISPGTPDRPVVIEPDPEPDTNPNPGPAPAPEPEPEREADDEPRTLTGSAGDDVLVGGNNDDTLTGSVWMRADDPLPGYDVLIGGAGDDRLENGVIQDGGPGNDTLITTANHHEETIMIGGPGRDVFVPGGQGDIRIMDFQDGVDQIKFDNHPGGVHHARAVEAGIQWDMNWIAEELENGVEIYDGELMIVGVDIANLQVVVTDDGFFIV